MLCCATSQQYPLSADRNSPCVKGWESKTDSKEVCVVGPLQSSRKKDSGLSQNFIFSFLKKLSQRNAKSTASNYLTIANNELGNNVEPTLSQNGPQLADSETTPPDTNQELYRVSHESVSKINPIHNRVTGLLFHYSHP